LNHDGSNGLGLVHVIIDTLATVPFFPLAMASAIQVTATFWEYIAIMPLLLQPFPLSSELQGIAHSNYDPISGRLIIPRHLQAFQSHVL